MRRGEGFRGGDRTQQPASTHPSFRLRLNWGVWGCHRPPVDPPQFADTPNRNMPLYPAAADQFQQSLSP